TGVTVQEATPTGTPERALATWTAPSAWASPSSTDPLKDCYPGGTAAPCKLTLQKIGAGGAVADCQLSSVDCTSYDGTGSQTTTYQCQWGGHVVPLSDCGPLKVRQAPATTTPTTAPSTGTTGGPTIITNPDGSTTSTTVNPDGSTTVTTTTSNGTKIVRTTMPDGSTSTTTTPAGGSPSTVTTPATGTGVQTDPVTDGSSCSGSYGWNPLSWVLNPVKCALRWAFVPPAGTFEQVGTLRTLYTSRPPGSVITAGSNVVTGFFSTATAGDCGSSPDFTPTRVAPAHSLELPNRCAGNHTFGVQGESIFGVMYAFEVAVVWVGVCLSLWSMANKAFGGETFA
ncbi:MAG: hypothetical protein JWM31_109, partial [Solirubrobacterales bacterium]|nr:hypothetical protein [Solirubrobacterales bacterium]